MAPRGGVFGPQGLTSLSPASRIGRPRRNPPFTSKHRQPSLPFRVAAWPEIRLRQFRRHRMEAVLSNAPDTQQRCASKRLRAIAGLADDQVHELPEAHLRFVLLFKVAEETRPSDREQVQGVQQVHHRPHSVQIVRKAQLRLESGASLSLSPLRRGLLLDHCHSVGRDAELPRNLLPCHSLRTHFNDLSVTLTGGLHGTKTPRQRAGRLREAPANLLTAEYLDGLLNAGDPPPRLFTVGYGGRKPAELTALLRSHGVITVADVRLRPDRAALGAYAKAKTPDKGIEKLMRDASLGYVSLVELGNLFVDLDDWQRRYAGLLKAAGPFLIERLLGLPTPCCLLCCEKDSAQCHRRLIAEYMARRGWIIEHIL